jgi:hypothetical protein
MTARDILARHETLDVIKALAGRCSGAIDVRRIFMLNQIITTFQAKSQCSQVWLHHLYTALQVGQGS